MIETHRKNYTTDNIHTLTRQNQYQNHKNVQMKKVELPFCQEAQVCHLHLVYPEIYNNAADDTELLKKKTTQRIRPIERYLYK